jgi:hypothetical protein
VTENDELAHICKLATIAAVPFARPREEWLDYLREADEGDLSNAFTSLRILSKAFLALLEMHPELKPTFRVRAGYAPSDEAPSHWRKSADEG